MESYLLSSCNKHEVHYGETVSDLSMLVIASSITIHGQVCVDRLQSSEHSTGQGYAIPPEVKSTGTMG